MQTCLAPTSPLPADSLLGAAPRDATPIPMDGDALRVLLVVESSGAGTGRHVLDLAEGLAGRGHDVHIIYSTGRVDQLFLDRLAELKNVRTLALVMKTIPHFSDIGVVRAVRRYLKEFGPFDAIHGHSSKGGAIARLAAVGTAVPAFYTPHGLVMMDPRLPRWQWLFYFAIERGLALRTARIIAVSPEEQRATLRLGFTPAQVIMVPNGVGELKLTPRAEARRDMGVPEDAIVIGFVGRLVEQKAPDMLLRAFAASTRVSPKVYLAMVGSGTMDKSLRELAGKLEVADKVIWLGARDARGVFAGFDIFALASRKEGLPYVVLEAMSAGLPIVATTSAGVEILVITGSNGVVVPTDDVSSFAQGLVSLVCDPRQMVACARSSRERALQFSIESMVQSTIAAYRSAMSCSSTAETQEQAGVACEL